MVTTNNPTILPFTVLRRLDCVLEPTKTAVLAEFADKKKAGLNPELFLLRKACLSFYNTSPLDMHKLMGDQDHIRENLFAYVQGFSPSVRDIFERFDFSTQIDRLAKNGLLFVWHRTFDAPVGRPSLKHEASPATQDRERECMEWRHSQD
jgi:type I restriction-modification system DNA methylase subunit